MSTAAAHAVHVADNPTIDESVPSLVQRCARCGFTLVDNTAWWQCCAERPTGYKGRPSWYRAGTRIGTGKTAGGRGGMTYPLERDLTDGERLCTGPAGATPEEENR